MSRAGGIGQRITRLERLDAERGARREHLAAFWASGNVEDIASSGVMTLDLLQRIAIEGERDGREWQAEPKS